MEHNDEPFVAQPVCENPAVSASAVYAPNNILLDRASSCEPPALRDHAFSIIAVYEPPRGEIEEELARIWSETLNIPHIDRNAGFFELSGDSLSATAVLHKIQDVFCVELPLRTIFELQTIKNLAEAIDNIYLEAINEAMDEGSV